MCTCVCVCVCVYVCVCVCLCVCVCVCVRAASTSEMAGGSPQHKHPNSQTTERNHAHLQVIKQRVYAHYYYSTSLSDINKREELQKEAAQG